MQSFAAQKYWLELGQPPSANISSPFKRNDGPFLQLDSCSSLKVQER